MPSRREFLKISSLASAALLTPAFLRRLNGQALPQQGRKLVVIQLSGGNDGLNTVIPYRNDLYYKARPSMFIAEKDALRLSDDLALHPALEPLARLHDEGQLSILNAVGYPNPDRSHFRSMDIWHSASDADTYWESGWLGRYLDHSCSGCAKPHQVLEIDDSLSLAVKGESSHALAVRDAKRLFEATQAPWIKSLAASSPEAAPASDLDFMYKTLTETVHSAAYIYEKTRILGSRAVYPPSPLGRQLKLVSDLIINDIDTQVFYVSMTGFDTHVRQRGQHERLLGQYAEALGAFVQDLKQNNRFDETLILTFSEFGRRVEENAAAGTDHGKANNLFVVGGKLATPGIYNPPADLADLDEGDIKWKLDFRQVYATVLRDWLSADDEAILRAKYKRLRLV